MCLLMVKEAFLIKKGETEKNGKGGGRETTLGSTRYLQRVQNKLRLPMQKKQNLPAYRGVAATPSTFFIW